jgi:hypothetical protein
LKSDLLGGRKGEKEEERGKKKVVKEGWGQKEGYREK